MNNKHDAILDYLNNQLSDRDREAFEYELKHDKELREELQEWEELMEEPAWLLQTVDPPAGMKERVLGSVFAEDKQESPAPKAVFTGKKKNKRYGLIGGLLAAGLLLSVGANVFVATQLQQVASQNEQLEEELTSVETAMEEQQESGTASPVVTANLEPAEDTAGTGIATLAESGNQAELLVQAQELDGLEGNEVYQVWLIEGESPIPAGSFTTDADGRGGSVFSLTESAQNWDAIAVTREPQPDNELPEGEVVLQAEI
ncbi:anti-sigma-K factor rskA [Sinobaca qinghaiensis]|uniref:Anti-sigma-K factor rskA n=1 Tax=Sinobaca qinghaiensis TaxID=342944 RepID=A0A419V404_9BACL|nr:anti-sigma factor [Sinobaca qinghaiensis]RKD73237.1 anti-sigma-K factor rskA [Sinobaca qinghaiensis]